MTVPPDRAWDLAAKVVGVLASALVALVAWWYRKRRRRLAHERRRHMEEQSRLAYERERMSDDIARLTSEQDRQGQWLGGLDAGQTRDHEVLEALVLAFRADIDAERFAHYLADSPGLVSADQVAEQRGAYQQSRMEAARMLWRALGHEERRAAWLPPVRIEDHDS